MSRGIIYVMTTVVPGLIKIGKTGSDNFESRMYNLERHGYSNVVGLQRRFAIEVDDYDEKEALLDDIFSKSNVPNTVLFAIDVDLVIQLLSSFDGKQIYPENTSKDESFSAAVEERKVKGDWGKIPEGTYYLPENVRDFGEVKATMRVEDGSFIVIKESVCAPVRGDYIPAARRAAIIENNILKEDVSCNSPSTAAHIVRGMSSNGWVLWRDSEGKLIDNYR